MARTRSSRRPPLGPDARRILPLLAAVSAVRGLATAVFAAGVATLLAGLARAGFDAAQAAGDRSSSGLPEFIGDAAARLDGLFPAWLGLEEPGWAWRAGGVALLALLARALGDWGLSVAARRAAGRAKSGIRARLLERILGAPAPMGGESGAAGSAGGDAVLVSRGLDALDDYYVKTLTAAVASAVIPLLVWIVVALHDVLSAVVLALTVPLVPLFMALIGGSTLEETRRSQNGLLRLSEHIVELARGLPVLVGLRRDRAQAKALEELGEDYRRRTMRTLRSAFMSSLALELITTLSVAVVAVFIGVRLVNGGIGLDTALLLLLIAPECFQPLRDLGTAFHQSQDGVEALRRAEERLEAEPPRSPVRRTGAPGLRVVDLRLGYPGREAVLRGVGLRAEPGEITALTGPSGCGKSSLLHSVAGLVGDESSGEDNKLSGEEAAEGARLSGEIEVGGPVLWIDQSPEFTAPTVLDEVGLMLDPDHAEHWLRGSGAEEEAEEAREPAPETTREARAVLVELGIEDLAALAPAAVSSGQARRLAVARVLAAVRGSGESPVVLVDEPTAHLDAAASARVGAALERLARAGATVLAVTHDAALAAAADRHLRMSGSGEISEAADGAVPADHAAPGSTAAPPAPADPAPASEPAGERTPPAGRADGASSAHDAAMRRDARTGSVPRPLPTLRALGRLTGASPWRVLVSIALAFLTVAFGAALTALSGWLIVRASQQPGLMYLLLAITGVRFFGLGRAIFRYAERLFTHDLALRASERLRIGSWLATGRSALGVRSLLRGSTFLDRLIGDVDDLRDALPRVLLPAATQVPVMAAAVLATAITVPSATWLVALAAVLGCTLVPWAALRADRSAEHRVRSANSATLRLAADAIEAADDVRGNGLVRPVLRVVRSREAAARRASARAAYAAGLGGGASLALWWATALGVVALAWGPVTEGAVSAPVAAIPVLLCTALVEPTAQATEALRSWPALARLVAKIDAEVDAAPLPDQEEATDDRDDAGASSAAGVEAEAVAARWPGMERPALTGLSGGAAPGRWWGITGPSGSGKTTALAVLLGFLPAEEGRVQMGGALASPGRLRGLAAWCPQNAYVFDSTLRGNLSLARPRGEAPTDEEMGVALERVGLDGLLADLPRGLETGVGAGGSRLSGGQRQRLAVARALLTSSPLLLLDEPTAHLDAETAERVMEEIARGTAAGTPAAVAAAPAAAAEGRGRGPAPGPAEAGAVPSVVIVSHRPEDLRHCDDVTTLGPAAVRV
ncbi:thiol reductant ABC exporter subunit CydC [Rothia halotolerans]|uniref:thiol reductant ABC exporter subunit CydC n=1 Tax=Rothia halotolerans TaxID=405770 RepID=UPI00101DB349|nr:thiol reductant ABC exporter subunit CydC [Rothia halotolerans]